MEQNVTWKHDRSRKEASADGWRKDVSVAFPANYLHHTLDTGVLLGVAEDVHVKVEKAVCPCP